jgi:membrane protein YdbS with pleckstrin-like domain
VAFPRRLLNENEDVLLDLRPHWSYFLGRALVLLLAVVAFVAVAVSIENDVLPWVLGVLVLIALARLVLHYASWTTTEFVVTTDRLILRAGVLSKKGMEIPLERVNTVFFSQKLRERIFGFGDLVIESGGERGQQVINDVPHPERVQSVIHGAMEDEEDIREGVRTAPAPATDRESVLDQIDRLDQLRQRGVISQAEFDTKKAELLERL